MGVLIGVLEQSMIYAILALGVYITYQILDFPDLTVDGSFPLGAAVTVSIMTSNSIINSNPFLIIVIAGIAGGLAGLVTGIIHVKFKVRDLLSGIITMTGLYSINLHIAGKANVPIFDYKTIFNLDIINKVFTGGLNVYQVLIISTLLVVGIKILLDLYLKTRSGYLLRAVGNNSTVVTSLAKDSGSVKILGLVIANSLVAISGSIMAQQQGFFEITMGTGAVVIGLATVIIGTNLFKTIDFLKPTTAVIVGSIIYKICISLAMDVSFSVIIALVVAVLGFVYIQKEKKVKLFLVIASTFGTYFISKLIIPYEIGASDMKLITSIFFLMILIMGNKKSRRKVHAKSK